MTATVHLRLQLSLHVSHPRPDDQCFLHVYPSHILSVYPSYPLSSSSALLIDLPLPIVGADRLWFELYIFSDSDDADGLYSETPEGVGYLPLLDLKENTPPLGVRLNDVDGKIQATVGVTWCPHPSDREALKKVWQHTISVRHPDLYTVDPDLIDKLLPLYDHLRHDPNTQNFFSYSTPNGPLPILCFAVLLTRVFYEPHDSSNHSDTLVLMMHLIRLSCASLQLDVSRVTECDDVAMAELLGEMLSWIPRCVVYIADHSRRGKGKTVSTDYWSRPLTFPHLGNAGCDCEDSNGGIVLELFSRLQFLHQWTMPMGVVEDAAFHAVKYASEHACRYVAGVGLGTLRVGRKAYEAHFMSVILDRRYVEHITQEEGKEGFGTQEQYLPAIVVEGTHWTAPAWESVALEAAEEEEEEEGKADPSYLKAEHIYKSTGKEEWLRRLLRSRLPALEVKRHRVYGLLSAVLFPHFRSVSDPDIVTALHLVLHQGKDMGVETSDLLLYKCTGDQVIIHGELDEDYIHYILNSMCDFPASRIPSCPRKRESEAIAAQLLQRRRKANLQCIFSARARDAMEHQTEIVSLLGRQRQPPLTIPVTEDCSCVEFYL